MPRANRLGVEGGIFHLTHRCHNRQWLLKFARDRDAYRTKLRAALEEFKVKLLTYCLTCNHVHLLVDADDRYEVAGLMHKVAGESAQAYNRRKGRMNAFWGDCYHATLVDGPDYLWECLIYIELNMVRCGKIQHPSQWEWQGYHEIALKRLRYRLLDLDQLCLRLGLKERRDLASKLDAELRARIEERRLAKDARWTEAFAVGNREFVERIQPLINYRQRTQLIEDASGSWVLKDAPLLASAIAAQKARLKVDFGF